MASSPPSWQLTDKDWRSITHEVNLPGAARQDIELAISTYRSNLQRRATRNPPAKARANLERAAKAARGFIAALASLGDQEKVELRISGYSYEDYWRPLSGTQEYTVVDTLNDASHRVKFVGDWCVFSADFPRGKSGSNARPLRELVRTLDGILRDQRLSGIDQSKKIIRILHLLCEISGSDVGNGSIVEAVKAVIAERSEIKASSAI